MSMRRLVFRIYMHSYLIIRKKLEKLREKLFLRFIYFTSKSYRKIERDIFSIH